MNKISFTLLFLLSGLFTGCGANEGILLSGKETPSQINAASEKPAFTKDLEAMRTAGFTFIYVLRRKDGGTLDTDDINVIKQHTVDTNRRVKSDNDRAVIIGSNYQLLENDLAALYDRFAVEIYSDEPPVSTNVNTNSNN